MAVSFQLCTICLNEMQWLEYLYRQHRNWPAMSRWVFIEAADVKYAEANPGLVSESGLSIDGTSALLRRLQEIDPRVVYIPHGWCSTDDPAQGKVAARQRYMEIAEDVKPDFLFLLDADEFYTREHQAEIVRLMSSEEEVYWAFSFAIHNVWRPPSCVDLPLLSLVAKGYLFGVQHCKGWRWFPGNRYSENHVVIETKDGCPLIGSRQEIDRIRYYWRDKEPRPQLVHLGWTGSPLLRLAKNKYYALRGEGKGDGREKYMDCRNAWEHWKRGDRLPHGCVVKSYGGPIPEVFKDQVPKGSKDVRSS